MDFNPYSSEANHSKFNVLTKSLERLSIYDGRGKVKILQLSSKAEFLNAIGDLDLDEIEARM